MALQVRPFEIVVWGASGFTGRLVCQHIAKDYQGRVKWAIAGRDGQKLERIKAELVKINGDCKVGVACWWFGWRAGAGWVSNRLRVCVVVLRHQHCMPTAPCTQDVPILIADAYDGVAVGQVLAQTKVVIAMSGPYALYGDKV